MKYILLLISIISLAGCVDAPAQKRWYKKGVSIAETNNILAQCEYDVGMNKVSPAKERKLINSCMVAQGFRWGFPRN